jgi:hypothetical protein
MSVVLCLLVVCNSSRHADRAAREEEPVTSRSEVVFFLLSVLFPKTTAS